ncbi:hypothetical protein K1719_045720 [Acacia pycnantha]|nr:hypothetical protein K1719_045720 [Acacia pycnantha]
MSSQEQGRPLPKFGEWDVKDPASAEGFTVIFNKARDEKKTGGTSGRHSSSRRIDSQKDDKRNEQPVQIQGSYFVYPLNIRDSSPHVVPLLRKVGSVEAAKKAIEAGVDVIIAQGREAGGHVIGPKRRQLKQDAGKLWFIRSESWSAKLVSSQSTIS